MQNEINPIEEPWGDELFGEPLSVPIGNNTLTTVEDEEPSPGDINWESYDVMANNNKRHGGVTRASYDMEEEIFKHTIDRLPDYDENMLRDEMMKWDFSIPNKDSFDFGSLAETYSRIIAYRFRLAEIIGAVSGRYEFYSSAHKTLNEMAHKLSTGTGPDKKGNAAYLTAGWSQKVIDTKQFLTYILEIKSAIEFSSFNLGALMRERQALARINTEYTRDGDSHRFERSGNSEDSPKNQSTPSFGQPLTKATHQPFIRAKGHYFSDK